MNAAAMNVVGVDLAKNVFQAFLVEPGTGEIKNVQIKRAKFREHFVNRAPCIVGMEAIDELLARVQAVQRRSSAPRDGDTDLRGFNGLSLDLRSLRVTAGGRPVHLGPIEFKLLNLFVSHPDRVLTRSQIVDRVWRINAHVDERTVDVWVGRLRRALTAHGAPDPLRTVRSLGYVLDSL